MEPTTKHISPTRVRSIALFTAIAFMTLATANAHENATGVVKKRMMAKETVGQAMKELAKQLKSGGSYDADKVKINALVIQQHSGDFLLDLFPQNSTQKPSETKLEIWQNWANFSDISTRLWGTAGILAIVSQSQGARPPDKMTKNRSTGQGMTAQQKFRPGVEHLLQMPPQASFMEMAKTCKECHANYRQKK